MKKTAGIASETSPYSVPYIGVGILDSAYDLSKAIKDDRNLSFEKKESLLAMIDNPEIFNKLAAGYTGTKLSEAIAEHNKMHPVTKMLMGAAGFSLGQKIYQILFSPGQFTKVDPERNTYRIKL